MQNLFSIGQQYRLTHFLSGQLRQGSLLQEGKIAHYILPSKTEMSYITLLLPKVM